MGRDPKTSLLNGWNQLHACKNVLITDGACMTSTGTQNPTLTFMALTARAANHVVEEMRKSVMLDPGILEKKKVISTHRADKQ